MTYSEYDKEVSKEEKEFAARLISLCKYGLENLKEFERLINEDFSDIFSRLNYILYSYPEACERSEEPYRSSIRQFDINELTKQILIFESLNNLEQRYKIVDKELIQEELINQEFVNFVNSTSVKYDEKINELFDIVDTSVGINNELNKFLSDNDCINEKTGKFEVEFIFEDKDDFDKVGEYFEKLDYIRTFVDNLTYSYDFVMNDKQEDLEEEINDLR